MTPHHFETYDELTSASENELIEIFNVAGKGMNAAPMIADELRGRRLDRHTMTITRLTWVILVLTLINVLAVVISLLA